MLRIALRDLQHRSLRFVVSLVAVAFVFATTLLLGGIAHYFDVEVDRTLASFTADTWVIAPGATGPFFGAAAMPVDRADLVAQMPGVKAASPVVLRTATVSGTDHGAVNMFGVDAEGPASPALSKGEPASGPGQAVVSSTLGPGIGEDFEISGQRFEVVGIAGPSTLLGGIPNVFVTVGEAQRVGFSGAPVITAIAVDGEPEELPAGLAYVNHDGARRDLITPVGDPQEAIQLVSILLWLVAAAVIGSFVYLSARERTRDFAVLKATGFGTRPLVGGLLLQAALVALTSSLLALAVASLLVPIFPMPVELSTQSELLLPGLALAIAGLASLAGIRQVATIDPVAAFAAV